MIPRLTTRRLVLRAPVAADVPAIARYLNNFAVVGNLARVPYPYSVADAEHWLNALPESPRPEATPFAIELPEAGYIGTVGFQVTNGEPELGYWLAEPFWHRGIMTEAAAAVIAWYFGLARSDLIRSGVFHFNRASLAVQRKLGFVETGESLRHCLARGEEVRHIDTELSRESWAGAVARAEAERVAVPRPENAVPEDRS